MGAVKEATEESRLAITEPLNQQLMQKKELEERGVKFDAEKPQLSILTRESLIAEARAFEYGAKKYSRNNYKKGMEWTRLIDASLRHITAFNAGEDVDNESSLNHLWHAKACLAMLIYYYENRVGTDDRDTLNKSLPRKTEVP